MKAWRESEMRKIILVLTSLFLSVIAVKAQVPYFSSTAGDGNLYGYTSVKFRPGQNAQETYTAFQYGIGNYSAVGADLYTHGGQVYWGVIARGGYNVSKWYGLGMQATPSFDLNDDFKFSYVTIGVYQNGSLTPDGNLFWCSNTWATINRNGGNSWNQWWYLGYIFKFDKKGSVTPMVGCLHDWEFRNKANLAVGLYYSYKKWNFYVWSNDLCESNPRVVIGVDFCLPTKLSNKSIEK